MNGARDGRSAALLLLMIAALLAGAVEAVAAEEGGKSLASEARDPTGSVMAFNLRYDLTASFHGLGDETSGVFLIQPVIPFKLWGLSNIARVSIPTVTHTPSGTIELSDVVPGLPSTQIRAGSQGGLSDSVLLDIVTLPVAAGRVGLGPVLGVPTATSSSLGSGKWTLGPAGAAILKAGPLQYGGLFQGFFSFAGPSSRDDVNALSFQPFFAWGLPHDWAVGVSEMSFVYDFERAKFTSIPIGLSVEKLLYLGTQPVRTFVQVEYNLQDDVGAAAWILRFNFAPLFVLGGK